MFEQNVNLGPGTGTFTTHTFEILTMLLVSFLLGLWLGWMLWNRYKQMAEKLQLENQSLQLSTNTLRSEADALKQKLSAADSDNANLKVTANTLLADQQLAEEKLAVQEHDLKALLERNRELETELALAATPDRARGHQLALVNDPGETVQGEESYEMYRAQVEAAADNYKDEAENEAELAGTVEFMQETPIEEDIIIPPMDVTTSREVEIDLTDTATEVPMGIIAPMPIAEDKPAAENSGSGETEELALAAAFVGEQDDLKIVEGIGPKIESLLHAKGVHTYSDLAATSVGRLKEILTEAGPRFSMHDPGTWSAQALLAANGEWENLKAYQDFLNAGKRPTK
jgi:predicted flap endonuclease-1-like 5' DNA nuclease